jgi:hypothetical protein
MRLTRLVAAALAVAAAAPAAASARAPAGDWSYIRKDAFRHYACRDRDKGSDWTVRTATYFNNKQDAIDQGIGAYTTIARGSNDKLVASKTSTAWKGGYVRTTLKGAELTDRLWMQGAYYGPSEPWSDGYTVRRLTRC